MSKRARSAGHAFCCESLEGRQLLSASFSNADISGAWGMAAMGAGGVVQLNGAGRIVGGALADSGGSTVTPAGTYAVSAAGKVTVSAAGSTGLAGAINAARDVVGLSATKEDSLTILVRSGSGTFSNADLTGTWDLFVNGDRGPSDGGQGTHQDNSGHGVLTLDGAGHVAGTFTADESGRSEAVSGTYQVGADGSLSVSIAGLRTFVGRLNASKDVGAMNPSDLASAASTNDSRLVAIVRRSGRYTNASLAATWTVATDKGTGTLTFDAAGKVAGTLTFKGGAKSTITGTYAVTAAGTFSANVITQDKHGTHKQRFAGAIAATHDVVLMDQPGGGKDNGLDDLVVMVSPVRPNRAPTLTAVKPLSGAQAGRPFTVTYAALAAAANESDPDGDPIAFRVESVKGGTLTKAGVAVRAGVTTLGPGESLVWTPAATATGEVAAFGVTADDGTARSKPIVVVKVVTKRAAAKGVRASGGR